MLCIALFVASIDDMAMVDRMADFLQEIRSVFVILIGIAMGVGNACMQKSFEMKTHAKKEQKMTS